MSASMQAQIITPGKNIFSYMAPPSEIRDADREGIFNDAKAGTLIDKRISRAGSFPWALASHEAESDRMLSAVRAGAAKALANRTHLLAAISDGYSVLEAVWKTENGLWAIDRFVPHERSLFRFKTDGTLQYSDRGIMCDAPPYKFVAHRHGASPERPAGRGIISRVYWPWKCKQLGWEFWLQLADRFGVPSILALFDLETVDEDESQKRADAITSQLAKISSDSAAALANIRDVKVLEANGAIADYNVLLEACNREISFAITSQTLATGESEYGTRAQALVHEDMFADVIVDDAASLAKTLNETVVRWIAELNFPNAPAPEITFNTEKYASWEVVRDAIDRGIPVSRSAIYERYKIPKPAGDEDMFVASGTGAQELADL